MTLVTDPTGMPRTSTELPGYRPGAVANLAVMVIVEGPCTTVTMPNSAAATTAAVVAARTIRMGMRFMIDRVQPVTDP